MSRGYMNNKEYAEYLQQFKDLSKPKEIILSTFVFFILCS